MNRRVLPSLRRLLGRFDILIVAASIWFLGKFIRYVFPPLFELLQETFAVSTTIIGWSFSLFLFAYAAVQFPSGVFCDKVGSDLVIVGGVLLSSVGALMLLADTSFVVYLFLMIILGFGTGVHKTAAVQLLSDTYPTHKGRVLGIFDTFGTFGGIVAPFAVILAASIPGTRPGWRILLFGTGLIGLAFMLAFILRVDNDILTTVRQKFKRNSLFADAAVETPAESTTRESTADPDWRSYLQLFENRRFSIFVIASICFAFTYQGIVSFLPLYLIQEGGLPSSTAGILYSVLFVASFSQLVSGELSDRVGTLPVIIGSLGLATVSTVVLIVGTDAGILVLSFATVFIGIGAHSFRPVRGAYLMESLPSDLSAGGFGIVRTLLMGSGAIAPGIVGTVSDFFSFRLAFVILAVSVGLATLLTAMLLVIDN